jgi:hypothetical protein
VSVSLLELFALVGSTTVPGAVMVAEFVSEPVAPGATVAITVYVAVAPTLRFTVSLMLPVPLAAHDAPDEATQVHVADRSVAGMMSATVAPTTFDGPLFVATIVYVAVVPGTKVVTPLVLVIARSAIAPRVSVSVAESLAGVGSVTPAGGVIEAVLASEPVAAALTVAFNVNVAVEPTARLTSALMFPDPLAGHVAPAVTAQVHVAPVSVAGSVSVTVAPVTFDGPALEATIVYVIGEPAVAPADPSVFVMPRFAVPVTASVSVAELFPAASSVTPAAGATVAVFANAVAPSVELAATVPVRVNVAVPPTARSTEALMLPVPLAGHVEPAEAVQVQVRPVKFAGAVSVTVAANAAEGPALDATIVYVLSVPATTVVFASVFVIARSTFAATAPVFVPALFVVTGSVAPGAAAAVPICVIVPDAVVERRAVIVYVTLCVGGSVYVVLIEPVPDAAPQDAPTPGAEHVHDHDAMPVGIGSLNAAPIAADGPPLVMTTL